MNVQPYIGIPYRSHGRDFEAVDCFGLVQLFYETELGIKLPDYSGYAEADDIEGVSILVKIGRNGPNWSRVYTPGFGDVCLFNIKGYPCHVGVVLPSNEFLHAFNGRNSTVERLDSISWKSRIEGYWRWITTH